MKMKKVLALVLIAALALGMFAGCSGDGDSGGGSADVPSSVKIGIINPETGALAGYGEGSPWTEQLVVDYVNDELGGIYFEEYDATLPIEIIYYDSESDTTKCTELAQKLIDEDKIDLMVVRHTPETVNPVSAVCEREGVPCISLDAPVDAWLAEGPYEWCFHGFWNLETMYECYSAMWKEAGFGEGTKVGIIFANDADGTAWANVFRERIQADGYELVDPGQYPSGTSDFSDIIQQFKSQGVQILCGTNTNPDFATFWRQSKQQGFEPSFITMGKAYLLKSDAEAIGADLMDGLATEVWWSKYHPFESSLTQETPQGLSDLYQGEKSREITQPMGYKYASMEIAVDALKRAGSLDKEAIRDAIAATDVDTIIGNISYNDENYALTTLAGGQWVKTEDGSLQLNIVDNTVDSTIPVTAELQPLK